MLIIDSHPRGAVILLDGAQTGRYTLDSLRVAVGTHAISVKLDDYRWSKDTFDVTETTRLYVLFLLFREPNTHASQ